MSKSAQMRVRNSDFGIPSGFVIRHSDLRFAVRGNPHTALMACVGTVYPVSNTLSNCAVSGNFRQRGKDFDKGPRTLCVGQAGLRTARPTLWLVESKQPV